MERVYKIAQLDCSVSQVEGDRLADEILRQSGIYRPENIGDVAKAFVRIGEYRTEGCGYSKLLSDRIADWVAAVYSETDLAIAEAMTRVVFELTSDKARDLAAELYRQTQNSSLKAGWLQTICYMGT